MNKKVFKEEVELLASYFASKLGDVASDLYKKYIYVNWEDYGISLTRIEYQNKCEITILPRSEHDCDLIRFRSIVSILGNQKFAFQFNQYGLDMAQEIKFFYTLHRACKRINKIKAFL